MGTGIPPFLLGPATPGEKVRTSTCDSGSTDARTVSERPGRAAQTSGGEGAFAVRDATANDLAGILAVEQASFTTPWSRAAFIELLIRERALVLVAESGGAIVGHGVAWWVMEEAEVANVAVAPDARGLGVGGALLDLLLTRARTAGARTAFLEVRTSNEAALRLYRSRGFEGVAVRRDYYTLPKEDAEVMRLDFPDEAHPQVPEAG